jgi:hypothetical protein
VVRKVKIYNDGINCGPNFLDGVLDDIWSNKKGLFKRSREDKDDVDKWLLDPVCCSCKN